jgi:hypothetical protein
VEEMYAALGESWNEENPCGSNNFSIDSIGTTWQENAILRGFNKLKFSSCNPNVVSGPVVDVGAISSMPPEFGGLFLKMKYLRHLWGGGTTEVDVVVVEDGVERNVAVIDKGNDDDWHEIMEELFAEDTVQLKLYNRNEKNNREVLFDEILFTVSPGLAGD